MPREENRRPELVLVMPPATCGPYWRAVIEDRWRIRLQEVTELLLAYHSAEAPGGDSSGHASSGPGRQEAWRLLRRAVAARRGLEDVEDALGRLATGRFGRCEQCGSDIRGERLAAVPETRYCKRCAASAAPSPALAGSRGASETW